MKCINAGNSEKIQMQFVEHQPDSVCTLCRYKVVKGQQKIHNLSELLDVFLKCFAEPGRNLVFKTI